MAEAVSSEPLQAGITQKAFTALQRLYPNTPSIAAHIQASVDSVLPFLSNATEDAVGWPLDRLSNGNAMLALSQPGALSNESAAATYAAAAAALRQSIDLGPRNKYGGLWYYVYPEWSYLDGMYSLAPFYTLAAGPSNTTALLDMAYQLDLLWAHNRNASSGLLVHGYDASLTAVWADPVTGASPHVWGRALGWYFMALVDTLEILGKNGTTTTARYRKGVLDKFQELSAALVNAVDPATGGWWQVLDRPGNVGNYIESSGSAMFSYGLLKGARLGYFDNGFAAKAKKVAKRAYQYVTDTFIVYEEGGTLGYNGTVAVCSLNSTATYEVSTILVNCDDEVTRLTCGLNSTMSDSRSSTTASLELVRIFSLLSSTRVCRSNVILHAVGYVEGQNGVVY